MPKWWVFGGEFEGVEGGLGFGEFEGDFGVVASLGLIDARLEADSDTVNGNHRVRG